MWFGVVGWSSGHAWGFENALKLSSIEICASKCVVVRQTIAILQFARCFPKEVDVTSANACKDNPTIFEASQDIDDQQYTSEYHLGAKTCLLQALCHRHGPEPVWGTSASSKTRLIQNTIFLPGSWQYRGYFPPPKIWVWYALLGNLGDFIKKILFFFKG